MSSSNRNKAITTDMTEGSAVRHILIFAIPLFIGNVFQQGYNFMDTLIAGRFLGSEAIAAIGATASFYALIVFFANGLNNGFAIMIAKTFGAKDRERLKMATASMLVLNILIVAVLTVVALFLIRPMMIWLDCPDEIYVMTKTYIQIIFAGMSTTCLYNMCAAYLRSIGNSKIPLYYLIVSCVLNLGMDVLFIVVLHMGIAGTALATVIAQGISGVLCLIVILRKYQEYLPEKKHFQMDRAMVSEMFTTGLSMGLMSCIVSMGTIVMQRSINALGTNIITAHAAFRKLFEFTMMPLSTLAAANATFVSQNFGAGKMDRIYKTMTRVLMMVLVWTGVSICIGLFAGHALVAGITSSSNPEILDNAYMALMISIFLYVPLGAIFVYRMALQPLGHRIIPLASSLIEMVLKVLSCIFIIPWAGYVGVAWTEPTTWIVCSIFLFFVFRYHKKKDYTILREVNC